MKCDRRSFLTLAGISSLVGTGVAERLWGGSPLPIQKAARLREGNTLALVNPAGATAHRVEIDILVESMNALGLKVKLGKHVLSRYGYLAGGDEERATDVMDQFADESVDGILAMRGGWGCARILPRLNFDIIRQNPKVLIGYSDVTALLLAVHAKTGLVTFHGPLGIGPWNSFSVDYFKRILFQGEAATLSNPKIIGDNLTQVADRVRTIHGGKARGKLLGGNLTVLSAIMGSEFLPEWEGSILFLEDIEEAVYRVDRMLTQLKLAGVLDRISGFVFGKCTRCLPGQSYGSLTLEQVFDDHIAPLEIPAWQGAMIGHVAHKFTVPVGLDAEIDADEGTIRLVEGAVR